MTKEEIDETRVLFIGAWDVLGRRAPKLLDGIERLQAELTDLKEKYSDYHDVSKANGDLAAEITRLRAAMIIAQDHIEKGGANAHLAAATMIINEALKPVPEDRERYIACCPGAYAGVHQMQCPAGAGLKGSSHPDYSPCGVKGCPRCA